jgi:hypothetical protein
MDSNFKNRDIDLFVLDVEGLELEVLNGMIDSNYLPTIMCIEYPHVGLTPLKKTMANLHYSLDTLMNNNAYFIKK